MSLVRGSNSAFNSSSFFFSSSSSMSKPSLVVDLSFFHQTPSAVARHTRQLGPPCKAPQDPSCEGSQGR